MDFKSLLSQLDQLNEATEKTKTGLKHTAEPGGYGRKDDEDEEGNKVKDTSAEKKGRGRPKKATQSSGEDKKYDFSAFGATGKDVKLPKWDKKKTTKHSLKEYFDAIDQEMLAEAEQIQIKPASQMPKMPGQSSIGQKPGQPPVAGQPQKNTQVIQQGNKTLGTVDNPQLAQQIKQSIGKGEMTLMPDQAMAEDGDYSAKKARAGKDIGKPGKAFSKIATDAGKRYGSKAAGERVAGAVLAKLRKTNEGDMPPNDSNLSPIGEGKKPDFLDLDKDGNKKESMKKAATDKKKVKEGMDHRIKAARHAGKAHALGKQGYNCTYDDMGEARSYHDGYKEGLDECYGQMPIQGYVGETGTMPAATVPGMASQAMPTMEDDMEEGNAFTGKLKSTPQGDKFTLGGKTFKDTSNIEESPFAFESLDKQLNALLEGEEVTEGMTVSISKGQQGQPDSVSVNAQDAEADQLLSIIKQAGLGLFGGDEQAVSSTGSQPMSVAVDGEEAPADIAVVDDHDDMLSLIRKMSGQGPAVAAGDYEEEGGEAPVEAGAEEEACETCGESSCGCGDSVEEDETVDQREYEVAEEINPNNNDEANEENSDAVRDAALAQAADNNEEQVDEGGDGGEASSAGNAGVEIADVEDEAEEDLDESYANSDDDQFETDIDFMTKVISGGLNKQKSTGQTTQPVIAGQNDRMGYNTNESVNDWKKLAGIK